MWDTYRLPLLGNFSLSKIALSFLAVLLSALFMALTLSSTTFAAPATWEGDNIKYNDHVYTNVTSRDTIPGVDPASQLYMYQPAGENVAYIIELKQGADTSKELTDVQLHKYKYEGGVYSSLDPPDSAYPQGITVGAKAATNANNNPGKTSCDIQGVGWIICGPSRWIASGMDLIYGWISDFLTVKPLSDDKNNGLYQAWDVVRGIANACFIIAFLVIIYSQITSYGINNYEIKKMIPRLIIAAVLVNVSYYICAYAVDLSNILGNSVQNAFIEVRESLRTAPTSSEGWDAGAFTFKNVTEYILSGGTVVAAGFAGAMAFAGGTVGASVSGLIFMMFPILIAGVLSVVVALVILAARQAIITVLIVIAPLAFVAFLLPNTDKWFEKWRGLSMTMLLVFPLFSLLFGGAQLASFIILQNADQLTVVLLALFVQVAPLALTPFLLQFSGSLLGRFAGMINNPKKGIMDRTTNWAQDRAQVRRAQAMEKVAKGGGNFAQRYAFKREQGERDREAWKKRGDSYMSAAWHGDSRYTAHHEALGEAELREKSNEAKTNLHFAQRKADPSTGLHHYVATQRTSDEGTKMYEARENQAWEEMKSAQMTPDNQFASYANAVRAISTEEQVADARIAAAKSMQAKEYVDELRLSPALQARVGGIDPHGATKAYNKAKNASYAAKAEVIKDIENGSDIMPGRTMEMVAELKRGVANNEVETVRAMINKLAASANAGTVDLRQVIIDEQDAMATAGMLDEIKFHLDGHPGLNDGAEDIVTFARDQSNRRLEDIGSSAGTWSNMTASKFMGEKQSTQELGLSTGGIDKSTLRDIMRNPGKTNLKPNVLRQIRAQLGVNPNGDDDHTI